MAALGMQLVRRISRWWMAPVFAIAVVWPHSSFAIAPTDGFFYGVDLEPLGNSSITTVETEPAVALVFAADQKTAEVTRQFNEWYLSTDRPAVEVFAIAVEPESLSREVVLEALSQRKLQMPLFLSRSDMLLGDDFRLLVLNDDMEVQRFTSLDFAGVNAALGEIGVQAPQLGPTPSPVEAPTVTDPTLEAATREETEPGMMPDDSMVTATSRSQEERTFGGPDEDTTYVNSQYGFTVKFPPGWKYQVAAQEDGAVALEPAGSRMNMRVWAVAAGTVREPQGYIDETLEARAQRIRTRINVDRRIAVSDDGEPGIDITYSYSKPLNPNNPELGGLLYRGRMQVFVDQGYVKAASVEAPSGEFMAAAPMIESFFRSFEIRPDDIPAPSAYDSPNTI